MAFIEIKNVKMVGTTVCVPKQIVENKDYEIIPIAERASFIASIGIERRRVALKSICTSDLCQEAAEHLINKIGWQKEDIELIVFVSQTPDYKMPSTSCVLQHRLELPANCMTIDISQGCSGYVYGLSVIGSLLSSSSIKKGLLLVGNTQSKNTNYKDKSTYPLFSDAGSATAFEYSPNSDEYKLSFVTDGSGENTIIIPDGGYRNPVTIDSFKEIEYEGGLVRNKLNLKMQGDDVFAFVASNIPKATRAMFEHFNIVQEDIDYYLLHHASKFIVNKLIKKLALPDNKVPIQLSDFGNSSNVSIPLLLTTSLREEVMQRHLCLYVSGFGVGLSLGVGVITIDKLLCADIIEK